jgi:hypothetical protein
MRWLHFRWANDEQDGWAFWVGGPSLAFGPRHKFMVARLGHKWKPIMGYEWLISGAWLKTRRI